MVANPEDIKYSDILFVNTDNRIVEEIYFFRPKMNDS